MVAEVFSICCFPPVRAAAYEREHERPTFEQPVKAVRLCPHVPSMRRLNRL
jgi:hypothetical protein